MNVYYTASLYQTPKILDNFQKTLVELKKKISIPKVVLVSYRYLKEHFIIYIQLKMHSCE